MRERNHITYYLDMVMREKVYALCRGKTTERDLSLHQAKVAFYNHTLSSKVECTVCVNVIEQFLANTQPVRMQ